MLTIVSYFPVFLPFPTLLEVLPGDFSSPTSHTPPAPCYPGLPLPCPPLPEGFANSLADDLLFLLLVVCFSSLRCVPKMTRITLSSLHPLLLVTVWYSRPSIRPGKQLILSHGKSPGNGKYCLQVSSKRVFSLYPT